MPATSLVGMLKMRLEANPNGLSIARESFT
jgi:hypothetical protein